MRYIFLLLILLLGSCSSSRPKGSTEAEVLYREAKKLVDSKHYMLATEKINIIRSKYPYSYYSTHAQLLSADILYEQKNYTEAAAAYIVFKDFYPKYKRASYVLSRIADSFYNQLPSTHDRDLNPGYEAIKYYRELVRIYPTSQYAQEAKKKIERCVNMIQEQEKYIADFYFKTKAYDSARYRYLTILENFTANKKIRDHAILRVIATSEALKDKKSCEKYYKKYKKLIHKNYREELKEAHAHCAN